MNITSDPLFNRALADMPKITIATVSYTAPRKFVFDNPSVIDSCKVEIPTSEVFEAGEWLLRRTAGVKLSNVVKWLCENGYNRKGHEMLVSVA